MKVRTYKYRLYPNKTQAKALDFLLRCMQTVYNDALNERKWLWTRGRRSTNYFEQWARFKQERANHPETMGYLNATSIQQMLRRVQKGYTAFYKGLRGMPRFKNKRRFKSLEYRHGDGCRLKVDRFYIQRVGDVRIKLHRELPDGAQLGHVIIKKDCGKGSVFFVLKIPAQKPIPHTGDAIGIDVGINSLLSLSHGEMIENPRWLRANLRKFRLLNRQLSRQKRYGANWKKTAAQIGKLHQKIARQRRDFWHKQTRKLVNEYSVIHTENLTLAFMLKGNLALSAHDASLGMFFDLLAYKCEETGSKEIKVNPQNTSILCSDCGTNVPKRLRVRIHHCPVCGLSLDRDVNAAKNILKAGALPLVHKVAH